jgi:hypothetical protein
LLLAGGFTPTDLNFVSVTITYAAPQLPAVSDGRVIVPKEATAEMISSGICAHYGRSKIQIHGRTAAGPMECAYVAYEDITNIAVY